jgi:outer membrane protein assembly factor BamB
VYVLSVNLKLACFDANTGKENWAKDLKAETKAPDLKWGNANSPVVDGDRIYVGGGGPGKSMMALGQEGPATSPGRSATKR